MEPDQGREEDRLEPETNDAVTLVERIKPLFADQSQPVIGTALANLVALYAVAHTDENPYKTKQLREQVLKLHLAMVRQLMPISEQMVGTALDEKARPN